jgi:hypothetical protein
MHQAPTSAETKLLQGATPAELLDYFLTRAMECEEIWGLSNASGWVMKEDNGTDILPVWNYAIMAQENAKEEWSGYNPDSTSLEHFVYDILPQLQEQDIQLEILPSPQSKGLVIDAKALFEIIERKLDTVEYFIEG